MEGATVSSCINSTVIVPHKTTCCLQPSLHVWQSYQEFKVRFHPLVLTGSSIMAADWMKFTCRPSSCPQSSPKKDQLMAVHTFIYYSLYSQTAAGPFRQERLHSDSQSLSLRRPPYIDFNTRHVITSPFKCQPHSFIPLVNSYSPLQCVPQQV